MLGAVVSTTDAIAATSIAERLGLPKRITDMIEGESLVNDASGLLALEFATALLVTGHTPSLGEGIGRLLYLVVGEHRNRACRWQADLSGRIENH